MLGKAFAVGVFGVLLLQMRGIGQDKRGDIFGRRRRVNRAVKPVPDQFRQIAAMVQMGMGQNHGVDRGRWDRKRLPVQFAQVLQPLEQPAIDEQPVAVAFQEMLGPGDRACAA